MSEPEPEPERPPDCRWCAGELYRDPVGSRWHHVTTRRPWCVDLLGKQRVARPTASYEAAHGK